MTEAVHHPLHYGGVDNPFETIKVIEATFPADQAAGFMRGNALKYLSRYENKGGVEDLKKARWYLDRLISFIEAQP